MWHAATDLTNKCVHAHVSHPIEEETESYLAGQQDTVTTLHQCYDNQERLLSYSPTEQDDMM